MAQKLIAEIGVEHRLVGLVNEPGDAFISSPVAELEDTKQMMKKWVTQDRMIRLPLSG